MLLLNGATLADVYAQALPLFDAGQREDVWIVEVKRIVIGVHVYRANPARFIDFRPKSDRRDVFGWYLSEGHQKFTPFDVSEAGRGASSLRFAISV